MKHITTGKEQAKEKKKMKFHEYMKIYEILSKLVEELKQEENTIKAIYNDNPDKYCDDAVYIEIIRKRREIESICYSIENMDI